MAKTDLEKSVTEESLQADYEADLLKLLDTTKIDIEAIITRTHQLEKDLNSLGDDPYLHDGVISQQLKRIIPHLVTNTHRCKIVAYHAQGLSTTEAVSELVSADKILYRLAENDAIGWKDLSNALVHQLSYLKPGNPRFPKKYQQVWQDARDAYKAAIRDMPLSSTVEQVKLLCQDAEHTQRLLENENNRLSAKEYATFKTILRQTIESINKLTVSPTDTPAVQSPQLLAIIERVTLALDNPEQLQLTNKSEQEIAHALMDLITASKNRNEVETQALSPSQNDNTD